MWLHISTFYPDRFVRVSDADGNDDAYECLLRMRPITRAHYILCVGSIFIVIYLSSFDLIYCAVVIRIIIIMSQRI